MLINLKYVLYLQKMMKRRRKLKVRVKVKEAIVGISEGVNVNKCHPRNVSPPLPPPPPQQTTTQIRGKQETEELIKKRTGTSKTVEIITIIITVKPRMI